MNFLHLFFKTHDPLKSLQYIQYEIFMTCRRYMSSFLKNKNKWIFHLVSKWSTQNGLLIVVKCWEYKVPNDFLHLSSYFPQLGE